MKIYRIAREKPNKLYHATYSKHLPSILQKGLNPFNAGKNWESSKNVICLASSPEVAESYAETSDLASDEDLDGIKILEIDFKGLDKNSLFIDSNIKYTEDELRDLDLCYEYHDIIPASKIRIYK